MRLTVGVAERLKTSTLHLSGEKKPAPMKSENINWVRLRVIGNALRHLVPISGSHFYPYSKRQMHSSRLWKLMGVGTQSTLENRACNVSDTGWMAEISSVSHLCESQTQTKLVKSTEPVPRGNESYIGKDFRWSSGIEGLPGSVFFESSWNGRARSVNSCQW